MSWYALLPRLWNMSLTASVVIVLVLMVRLVLRRAPAAFRCALWGVVLFRLLCPVSFSSVLSVFNVMQAPFASGGGVAYIPEDIVHIQHPVVSLPLVGDAVNAAISESLPQGREQLVADPLEAPVTLLTLGWMAGVVVMMTIGAVRMVRLRRALVGWIPLREGIRLADGIDTAFVLGVLRPCIYLPSSLPQAEREYVILHERQHICRGDPFFRLLGWIALCLHWFDLLVWVAFRLSEWDMELACDEAVVRNMDGSGRAAYSAALLHCASGQARRLRLMPAFGETGVRARIRAVLRYRKPAFWLVLGAAVLCAVLAVCTISDPKPGGMQQDGAPPPMSDTPQPDAADVPGVGADASASDGEQAAPDGEVQESLAGAQEILTEEITVPTLEPVLAQQTIQLILGTLRLTEEHGISFHIPTLPPKAEDGTELFLTLNATYRQEDGSRSVHSYLDNADGWVSGDILSFGATKDVGELIRVMLRAAYMIPVGENAYKELAASYVELTAPFQYNTAPTVEEPLAAVEYKNGESRISVRLQDGSEALLSVALPEGFVLAENWERSVDPAMPPAMAVLQNGKAVGILRLHPFATSDVQGVDPAENTLPMQIFATVALSNHAGYDGYTVIHAADTGAAAVCKFVWQPMETFVGDAAAVPWSSKDCVLAYDWNVFPCYMELTLQEGILTMPELQKVAHSVQWQKNG